MADSDRTPLVANAQPLGQTLETPGQLSAVRHSHANERKTSDEVSQPMLPNSAPQAQRDPEKGPNASPPPYTAFSPWRRRFILAVITVAGFFGPLAGGIYLPALPVLEKEFHASATAINVTVSVFMLTFAFGVSSSSASFGVFKLT